MPPCRPGAGAGCRRRRRPRPPSRRPAEGQPRRLLPHHLVTADIAGAEQLATAEIAGTAPVETGVPGHVAAGGGGAAELQWLVPDVGQPDRPVDRPGSFVRLDGVDDDVATLTCPLLAAVRDPGEPFGHHKARILDVELV